MGISKAFPLFLGTKHGKERKISSFQGIIEKISQHRVSYSANGYQEMSCFGA